MASTHHSFSPGAPLNVPFLRLRRTIPRAAEIASWIFLLLCSISTLAQAARTRDPLPKDLVAQWQKIKAESPDTGQVASLLAEGERIIQRLQELDQIRRDPKAVQTDGFDRRISQLQDRFQDLLRSIEMARVQSLPDPELEVMRTRYEAEREHLQAETRALEDTVIARGERFLATYKQQITFNHLVSKQEMIVDFLYHLAEIYYRRGEDQFYISNDIAAFKPALEKYQRIIDEFPASEFVDDALYNIAYIKNSSLSRIDQQEAIKLYKTLIEKYQTSPFVPEAYWRVGEYYFYSDPPQIPPAITYYSSLLNYTDTPWYVRGLYKIGWCHFRQADYPGAIEYFTRTVEVSMNLDSTITDAYYTNMLEEALEYISVCFAQDPAEWSGAGVDAALAYVQADSARRLTYGARVLEGLGDIYKFQIGKYPQAVEAYQSCLGLYPRSAKAPWIQEKVVSGYANDLRDFTQAYEEKDRLFQLYRSGTDWAQANPDSTVRRQADALIEKYYFQNISETIGRGLKNNDLPQIQQAVQMSRNYLEVFPTGPNAYTVNFNLAVLLENNLGDSEQAYAEYLKVSRDYTDDRHRKESAINAALIAQKLINQQGAIPLDSLKGVPLSDAETKYLTAADNYLELFPRGEEAELFLLNAGSINFNHSQFAASRVYYNRLLNDFPNGSRRGEAYKYIMNGYFAEGSYADAERVAKEIQAAGFDSTLLVAAKTRQAESAFLGAEAFKLKDNFLAAAQEYQRTALESPDFPQADKALFESGLAYQQAKAWPEANEVYLLLVERYPRSDLADKALYNVAYNSQSELHDQPAAAATFERLAIAYPKSSLAQDALRNASINYVESGSWAGAIRVNTAYTLAFPTAPDANVYLFENAGLYLKLGDETAAEQIYADYTKRYPNDPRAVRAHWERGKHLLDKNRSTEAYAEFSAGIQAHRQMLAAGLAGEETYGSRCLFEVIHADFAAYDAIALAPANAVSANKKIKLAKHDALMADLDELNKMAKDEMLEGLYSVGKVEEALALAFERQDIASQGGPEERILDREVANQDAIEINDRAIGAYRKAMENIGIAADVLRAKITDLQAHQSQLSAWVGNAQKSDPQPKELPDSTAALAELDRGLKEVQSGLENTASWGARAREKIPELALHNAEIKYSTVKAFLALPDVGKREELRLTYRAGVLSEFAAPRGGEVVRLYGEAYQAASTSAAPEDWKSKAKTGVVDLCATLENEFRTLNERALGDYLETFSEYQNLLPQGEGATTRTGLQAADLAEKLVFFSGQSSDYAKAALVAQATLLGVNPLEDTVRQGNLIPQEDLTRLVAAALEEVLRINDRYTNLADGAREAKDVAEQKKGQSVIWEDAAMTFEDCAYNFTEHRESILNAAVDFNQVHGADSALAQRLAWSLVALDRETYLPLLAQYGEEKWLRSEESFRVNPSYQEGWEALDCPESDWLVPQVIAEEKPLAPELAGAKAIWYSLSVPPRDSLISDTVMVKVQPPPQICDSLYFRKTFDLEAEPVAGDLWFSLHGGYSLQVNGELVAAVDPAQSSDQVAHYPVAALLHHGRNLITIFALDAEATGKGLTLVLRYKTLPSPSSGGP